MRPVDGRRPDAVNDGGGIDIEQLRRTNHAFITALSQRAARVSTVQRLRLPSQGVQNPAPPPLRPAAPHSHFAGGTSLWQALKLHVYFEYAPAGPLLGVVVCHDLVRFSFPFHACRLQHALTPSPHSTLHRPCYRTLPWTQMCTPVLGLYAAALPPLCLSELPASHRRALAAARGTAPAPMLTDSNTLLQTLP